MIHAVLFELRACFVLRGEIFKFRTSVREPPCGMEQFCQDI